MNGYIQISANGFLKPLGQTRDYFNLQLNGVSPNAFDSHLKPVVSTYLENLPCHPGFQTYPNLNGNLGVLEVIPVPTPELIDKMAQPLQGMMMPVPFKGTFTQHHIGLCLTPTVRIEPVFPTTRATRDNLTNVSIIQFEPNSGCYQLIELSTRLNALEFDVIPIEPNPHEHHFIETQQWVDAFLEHGTDLKLRAALLSMNKIAYMHRLFDRVDDTGDIEVANTFLPDFKEKKEEYLKSFFIVDTDVAESDSSMDSEDSSDSDEITGEELDAKLAHLRSLLPEVTPIPEPEIIQNVGAEVDIDEAKPQIQVIQEKPVELAYMEADDEVYVQPPGSLDASTIFNHTMVGLVRDYLSSARSEATLEGVAEDAPAQGE